MARKFGKRVSISDDFSDYIIGIAAPSGFGKTTLMYNVCEKKFGSDGYIVLDMGAEEGTKALQGVVAERVSDWKKFKDIVSDIKENKNTDYADLKVVILDTLDAAFDLAEMYTIKVYNAENATDPNFKKCTSINSAYGGYGKGLDKVIENVKKEIATLKSVGVGVWWCAHTKIRESTDAYTGETYTSLTASMMMKYFNAIKDSTHIIGIGYYDRDIEKKEVGETNPVTKKKKERNALVDESRKIKFRDDSLVADAKSRFAGIVNEIVLDTDEFIDAIQNAINVEKDKKFESNPAPKIISKSSNYEPDNYEDIDEKPPFDIDDEEPVVSKETIIGDIRDKFKSASKEVKDKVKSILSENGNGKLSEDLSIETLNKILGLLK